MLLRRAHAPGLVAKGVQRRLHIQIGRKHDRPLDLFVHAAAAHLGGNHQPHGVDQQAVVAALHPARQLKLIRQKNGVGLQRADDVLIGANAVRRVRNADHKPLFLCIAPSKGNKNVHTGGDG